MMIMTLTKLQNVNLDQHYTLAAIEDELVYSLYSVTSPFLYDSNKIVPIRQKYIEQAKNILYRTNVFQPVPDFVINLSDIPLSIRTELGKITSHEIDMAVTGAIARIYEDLDPRYFRISVVRRNIKWRIEP